MPKIEKLERNPIQPGKPDPTIFKYTNEVATHGFAEEKGDWLSKKYSTNERRRRAFRTHGKRELTAIYSTLISGLDRIVVNEMAKRPYDGLVENVNASDLNLLPEYQPIDIFNSKYELEYVNQKDGKKIKLEGRDGFFVLLAESMADTFSMAFDAHIDTLLDEAKKEPAGKMASIFRRLSDIEDFQKRFQEGKPMRDLIKENIQSGSSEMAKILKVIMTLNPSKPPSEISEIANNSYTLLAELAMMEGRISRNRSFGEIMWSSLYDPKPNHLEYFTMVTENGKARLDFSTSFKSIVQDIVNSEPDSGISERLACPAIKVVKDEENSVIKGMWNAYVSLAKKIYTKFYSQNPTSSYTARA